jgi:hypothetical protein
MKKAASLVLCYTFILVICSVVRTSFAQPQQPLLSFNPPAYRAAQANETFDLNLTIQNAEDLWGWTAMIVWDAAYLTLVGNPTEGDFLKQAGATLFVAAPSMNGTIPEITCGRMSATGVSGSGVLAKLTFKVVEECVESPVELASSTLLTPESDPSTPSGHEEIDHLTEYAIVTLILGERPVAYAGSPQTIEEGTQAIFNGSKTAPNEGNLTFTWSFFDGGPKVLEGMVASHTFEVPGIYDVILTVENLRGDRSCAAVRITVEDITPPVAVLITKGVNPGQPINVGQSITLDASQSYDPEDGRIQRYLWDLGDGTGNKPTAENTTYQYTEAGIYAVTLSVFDQRGNNSASQTIAVHVGQEYSQTVKLPPVIIGILAVVTALAFFGSAFWLRNRSPHFKRRNDLPSSDRR